MNALTNSIQKNTLQAARRFTSSTKDTPKAPFVPEVYNYSFKKGSFSNRGVYPLLGVLAAASCFIVGMTYNRLNNSPKIKITPEAKNAVIQNWGSEKVETVVKIVAKEPIAFNAQGFKSLRQEGLGIDHEEWKKGKEAYRKGE